MSETGRKLPWFRMYTEVVHDPKVQRLSAKLFRFWINCLCLAGENDGAIPPIKDIAWVTRQTEEETVLSINALVDAELIDDCDGHPYPHNWNVRQFKSDVSTPRVKRFRKRRETVSETAPEQIQIQSRSDTEQKNTCSSVDERALVLVPDPEVPKKRDEVKEWFDSEFWPMYPRKVAKPDALSACRKKANTPGARVLIIEGLSRQLPWFASEVRPDGDYRPYPATWLNGERWTESPTRASPAKKGGSLVANVEMVIGERLARGEQPW